jgi:SAM-dependent methyltransferase
MGETLSAELKAVESPAAWMRWAEQRDRDIRARLVQGDVDSLVNLMLFGTSFTARPRITLAALTEFARKVSAAQAAGSPEAVAFAQALQDRAMDLINAMAQPSDNERVIYARRLIESQGIDIKTAAGREAAKSYLIKNLSRVVGENESYTRILESARVMGDASGEFVERSKLFRDRGLSSDTSLMPNFAIEKSLAALKSRGLLAAASVRRVAIIGPGLDFTDKQDGYDFYPQQTIQPFAVIDSLLRLGLAKQNDLGVKTLDLSPRVNDHLAQARARAARNAAYAVQLPLDPEWSEELKAYWSRFGDQVGAPTTPVKVPAGLGQLKVRAVSLSPAVVRMIEPHDLNVVLQRMSLPPAEQFDLVIATNILVYYDVFEQSLALANIERMLRPGGLLLSNNALLELPGSGVRSVGYETAVYSNRAGDGDHIVWYQRQSK